MSDLEVKRLQAVAAWDQFEAALSGMLDQVMLRCDRKTRRRFARLAWRLAEAVRDGDHAKAEKAVAALDRMFA